MVETSGRSDVDRQGTVVTYHVQEATAPISRDQSPSSAQPQQKTSGRADEEASEMPLANDAPQHRSGV